MRTPALPRTRPASNAALVFDEKGMGVADVVRVGVIGTGFGASSVAPAFEAADDCAVIEVVTPRDDAAVAALCARADVDLISVHSPPFLHLDHVRRAIDAGHAVLCDKPFGLNAEESATMTELAKDAGVVNLLNFERRFDPGRERLRRAHRRWRDRRAEPLPVLAVHRRARASLQLALQSGARWRLARGAGIPPHRLLPLALR